MLLLQGVGKAMLRSVAKIFRDNARPYKFIDHDKPNKRPKVAKPPKTWKEMELPEEWMTKTLFDLKGEIHYEVSLLVDTRELWDSPWPEELRVEQRCLSIGDYMWVIRLKHSSDAPREYVYDCLVERKTVADLLSSHFSTHLSDQIARMRHSSFKVCWVVVEGTVSPKARAVVNEIEFNYDLKVVETTSQSHTLKWLTLLTREIKLTVATLPLAQVSALPSFQSFQTSNKPSNKPTDIFMQQLTSVEGISAKKATLLLRSFDSLKQLWEEAEASEESYRAKLKWCGVSEALLRSAFF
jgi:ERCC4-type nuclease